MDDIDRIIAGMSEAQKEMLLRPSGTYEDCVADVLKLLEDKLFETLLSETGLAVRARLLQGEGDSQ